MARRGREAVKKSQSLTIQSRRYHQESLIQMRMIPIVISPPKVFEMAKRMVPQTIRSIAPLTKGMRSSKGNWSRSKQSMIKRTALPLHQ
jgi:hypothetical protein